MSDLGRLEKVELRTEWKNEAKDFTPWLARDKNLALLGEVLGMRLELVKSEQPVGPYAADILCKDLDEDTWVLIENQLETTDHTHLGQVLIYAAGLNATTMVWIAPKFTEQHRAALDWLNEHTDEKTSFLGLEVELWRIGDSLPAPKFNIVAKPNGWSREFRADAERSERHPLTDDELHGLAEQYKVAELCDTARKALGLLFEGRKNRIGAGITFNGFVDEGERPKAVMSIYPSKSSSDGKLAISMYPSRVCACFGVEESRLKEVVGTAVPGANSEESSWGTYLFDVSRLAAFIDFLSEAKREKGKNTSNN